MNELLSFENDMLRDFIDLSERNHNLELVETVLEEGTVSKSLEIMFGESVEDMSTFDTFCMEQYLCAVEGFIKNSFNESLDDSRIDIVVDKLRKGIKRVKALIQSRGKNITYPIKLPKSDKFRTIDNLRHFMTSVTDKWHQLKYMDAYRDIEDFKNEPSPYSKDKNLNDVDDIKKFLDRHFVTSLEVPGLRVVTAGTMMGTSRTIYRCAESWTIGHCLFQYVQYPYLHGFFLSSGAGRTSSHDFIAS